MNNQINVAELIENLPMVNPNRQYWLVRTESGGFYEEFRDNNYIAIGWNEITMADIFELNSNPGNEELFNRVREKLPVDDDFASEKGKRASQSKAISQMIKFAYELKRGDVVVIPSVNSDYLSFGEIIDTPVYIEATNNCTYVKRKRVMWIKKDVRRLSLDSNLYRFIFAHQTVNNVTEYSEYINNTLFDFYTIDGKASLVLRVRKNEELDSFKIGEFYSDLLYFIKEFSEDEGMQIKQGDVNVKFDLQSPGTIIFIGIALFAFILIGVMTVLAGGEGGFEVDPTSKKLKFNFKSNSFLDKLSDFLDKNQARKERGLRMMGGLRHFEVDQNKELGTLVEPSVKVLPNSPANDIQDGTEVQ